MANQMAGWSLSLMNRYEKWQQQLKEKKREELYDGEIDERRLNELEEKQKEVKN